MRRQEFLLRSIIREMAWAGHLDIVNPEDAVHVLDDQNKLSPFNWPETTANLDFKSAERYVQSNKFSELATKYFSKLPFKVWTAPVIATDLSAAMMTAFKHTQLPLHRRAFSIPLEPVGLEILSQLNFPGLDRIDPQQDLVILYNTTKTQAFGAGTPGSASARGREVADGPPVMRVASPWMIIHAMLDGDNVFPDSVFKDVKDSFQKLLEKYPPDDSHPIIEIFNKRFEIFTMKSARDRTLGQNDILPEAATQELLTTGGFRYNIPEGLSQAAQDFLEEISISIKEFGDAWRSKKSETAHAAQGMLFVIRTLG